MSKSSGNSGLGWVVLAGGAFLGWRFLKRNVIQPKQLQAYSTRIRVTMPTVRFKPGSDDVQFDVYVQNPNVYPLTINAIVGDVFINYQRKTIKLGNVFRYGDVVIQPLAETKYPFAVRLKFIPLVAYFNDLLAGKAAGQMITFKGTITINKRPWPITESAKLSR